MKVRALLAALALAAVSPHERASAHEAHVLSFADNLDVTTLNDDLASSGNIGFLSQLTGAFLTRLDAHAQPVPELATVVPSQQNGGISRDGKTITWHLRRGVKWSDGSPFNADDVVFSIAVVKNPANNIYNRQGFDIISHVDEPNKDTVIVHLTQRDAGYFEHEFGSDGNNEILPKHILGSLPNINEAPYNALPVGIGPFRYTAFRRGDAVEMEANPYYFRGQPKLHKIVYRLITDDNTTLTQLQTGELDLWIHIGASLKDRVLAIPGKQSLVVPSQYTAALYLNVTRPGINDPVVRRALRYATDRDVIFEKVNHRLGVLQESYLPSVTRDFVKLPMAAYHVNRANALLDRDGWKRGPDGARMKNGKALSIEIAIPGGYQPSELTAELLRTMWARIGIKIDLHVYSTAQFFAPFSAGGIVNTGKFDAALLSESSGPIADSFSLLGCSQAPPNGPNLMRYCNHTVDDEFSKYAETYDRNEQARLAKLGQQQVDDDAPLIVLNERSFLYVGDAAIKNFHPRAFGEFDDFMNVDI